MSEKIDLERLTWDIGFVTDEDVLALVRLARAARAHADAIEMGDDTATCNRRYLALLFELRHFTDSAEGAA